MRKWSCLLQDKSTIRKTLCEKRRMIDAEYRHSAAHAATQQFLDSSLFDKSHHIACYFARADEFNTMPLIQSICHAGKICYLPVLSQTEKNHLEFIAYQPGDALYPNRYHILEPKNTLEKFSARDFDLVFMPLVAFDLQAHRLGMGGGYYDRTFAFLLREKIAKPTLVGLAFAEQQVDALPTDEWDVPLQGVVTEKRFVVF